MPGLTVHARAESPISNRGMLSQCCCPCLQGQNRALPRGRQELAPACNRFDGGDELPMDGSGHLVQRSTCERAATVCCAETVGTRPICPDVFWPGRPAQHTGSQFGISSTSFSGRLCALKRRNGREEVHRVSLVLREKRITSRRVCCITRCAAVTLLDWLSFSLPFTFAYSCALLPGPLVLARAISVCCTYSNLTVCHDHIFLAGTRGQRPCAIVTAESCCTSSRVAMPDLAKGHPVRRAKRPRSPQGRDTDSCDKV